MAGHQTYGGLVDLHGSDCNANAHTGGEKKFVDLVVARNPNTIDLEMALPAYSVDPTKRHAPRMDLVAIEPVGERWQIVFWEAKLVDDGRARCRGKAAPRSLNSSRNTPVGCGMRTIASGSLLSSRECPLLVTFRELAAKVNPNIEELDRASVTAATSDASDLSSTISRDC